MHYGKVSKTVFIDRQRLGKADGDTICVTVEIRED